MDKVRTAPSASAEGGEAYAHNPVAVVRIAYIPGIGLGYPLVSQASRSRVQPTRTPPVGQQSASSESGKIMEIQKRAALFARLQSAAAERASEIMSQSSDLSHIWVIGDDGYNVMERLAGSPCAEDQLVAVALRLYDPLHHQSSTLFAKLSQYFSVPALGIEIEAVRRSIWSDLERSGLPFNYAERAVERLQYRLSAPERDCAKELSSYAALYADLWCDPRIRATFAARRIMLAMVTLLADRARRVCDQPPGEAPAI